MLTILNEILLLTLATQFTENILPNSNAAPGLQAQQKEVSERNTYLLNHF